MNPEPTISTNHLAALFGVQRGTIQKWIDKGLPIALRATQGDHAGHQFNLSACVEWFFRVNFERLELDRARARLANEQADKTRMENDVRSQDLAEIAVIEGVLAEIVGHARRKLLALPRKIAPALEGLAAREREAVLDDRIRGALEELSAYRPRRAPTSERRRAP